MHYTIDIAVHTSVAIISHVDFSLGGVQRKLEALANNLRQVNY